MVDSVNPIQPILQRFLAVYVIPIYIPVFVCLAMGMFALLRQWLATFIITTFVPMVVLSLVILSFAAEFTSGFVAAGALLNAGILTKLKSLNAGDRSAHQTGTAFE
jgi:hypothetical protein